MLLGHIFESNMGFLKMKKRQAEKLIHQIQHIKYTFKNLSIHYLVLFLPQIYLPHSSSPTLNNRYQKTYRLKHFSHSSQL